MKSKVKKIKGFLRKDKDAKALVGNFGYMMVLQVAGYLFPLITIPYLARVIGVEGFGKIALSAAIVLWFQTVTDWGFNYTATRDLAKSRDNPEKVSEIFSNVFWARILLMALSFCLLLLLILLVPFLGENRLIILLTFLLIPGHIMFPEWFFQALEKMKFITFFSLMSKLFFTAMVFAFINEEEDFILQPVFMASGYLLCGLVAMYLIVVKWKVRLQAPRWAPIISTIKQSTDVFVTNIMPNFYYGFSTLLLGFFGGVASNGILDAGRKFVGIVEQFLNIISRVFYPYLARNNDKHGVYAAINCAIALFAAISLFLSANLVVKVFFTPEFQSAVAVLQISSFSLIFLSLRNIYGVNYLILRGHEKVSRNIIVLTSLMGFLIAFPLVYLYGYIGAAIVAVSIHAIQGLWMMMAAKSISRKLPVMQQINSPD